MKGLVDDAKAGGVKNVLDNLINPATEDTLLTIAGGTGTATTIADGRKVVAVAGTAEKVVAGATSIKRVILTALETNTDMVVIGGSTVVAAKLTRRGIPLTPLTSIELSVSDLSILYLDAVVSGEGVSFIYLN